VAFLGFGALQVLTQDGSPLQFGCENCAMAIGWGNRKDGGRTQRTGASPTLSGP